MEDPGHGADLLATIQRLYAAHPGHERRLTARCGTCLRVRSRALRADPPASLALATLDDYAYRGSLALLLAHLPPAALAEALDWRLVLWAWVHLPLEGPITQDPQARALLDALEEAGWSRGALLQARQSVIALHERRSAAAVERLHGLLREAAGAGPPPEDGVHLLLADGDAPAGPARRRPEILLDGPFGLALCREGAPVALASLSTGDPTTLAVRRLERIERGEADHRLELAREARVWAALRGFDWVVAPPDLGDATALGGVRLPSGRWRLPTR